MPHVILKGDFTFTEWSCLFSPVEEKKNTWLIKFSELYIERKGLRAIIPVVAVEEGHPQSYYVWLTLEEDRNRLSVRLDPSTDPVKTRGVKRSLALVTETIRHSFPQLEIDRHNLDEFFHEE